MLLRNNNIKNPIWVIALTVNLLSACGGSDSQESNLETAQGRFIDSPVAGLEYRSGGLSGTTDSLGTFRYELIDGIPQLISFEINGINLGEAVGGPVITPLQLVEAGSLDNIAVQNIARFLQMMDTDGNPSNGIEPSMVLLSAIAAFSWQQPIFQDSDFANQPAVTQIVADVSSVDFASHQLPSYEQAQTHLQSTLGCLGSGIYAGRFSGGDNGHFVFLIQHQRVDPP